jgi:hypothetical protein
MASTYSALKIELIATGEQAGTWGATTNVNLGDAALGEAITGSADVAFSSADVTITLTDTNTTQAARNLRLNLTGTSGGARNLILGSGCQIEKLYLVNNGLADAVTVKNTTGTGIAVAAGKTMFVYNNGTNVVDAITHLTSLTTGVLSASGATTFTAGTASTSTTTGTAVITGGLGVSGRINAANFDGIVGANTAAAGSFTTLSATGVATFSAGTVSLPAITTTGDTNTGIYFPAADTIAFTEGGTESMRIDSAGDVGIGTTNPVAKLHVVGGETRGVGTGFFYSGYRADGTTRQFYLGGSDSEFYINVDQAVPMILTTSGTERMRIDSTGVIGIGITTAGSNAGVFSQLQIGGTSTANSRTLIYGQKNASAGGIISNGYYDASNNLVYSQTYGVSQLYFNNGTFIFSNAASGTAGTNVTVTERMRIDTSGNVGIGTSSPGGSSTSRQLTLQGTTAQITLTTGSVNYNSGINASNVAYLEVSGANPLTFYTNSSERMRLDSNGNLGIGTTNPSAYNGSADNLVIAGASNVGMTIRASSGGANIVFSNAEDTGVDGLIQYDTTSNFMRFDVNSSERMRIDSSGNVGIGVSSTTAKLEIYNSTANTEMIIKGGASNNGGLISFYGDISGGGNYYRSSISGINELSSGSALTFATTTSGNSAPTERMRVNRSGNVGIGTTTPGEKLEVSGNIRMSAVPGTNTNTAFPILFQTSTGTIDGGSGLTYNPGGDVMSVNGMSITASQCSGSGSSATFTCQNGSGQYDFVATNDSLRFTAGGSEKMRIDSSGNVGIGTSSPSTYGKLAVYVASGDAEAAVVTPNANYATYRLQNNAQRYSMQIRTDISNAWTVRDETAGANRLVVDTSGRLLAGTSTSAYGGHELMYNPGASAWASAVINTKTDNSTVTNGFLVKYTGVSPTDGNYMFLCQDSSNTNRFYVTNAGGTGGTSDRNLKKNIETTRDGYAEDLCKLRIVKYNWKEQPDGTPKDLGWIAQEVEEVFPRMIKTDENTGIKSVTYSAFTPMLIKAIQEQQALIESLTTRLTALENK